MQLSQNFYRSHKNGAFKIKHEEMHVHMTSYLLHRVWTSRSDTQKQSKQSQRAKESSKVDADRAFSPLLPKCWRWSCCHTSSAGPPQPRQKPDVYGQGSLFHFKYRLNLPRRKSFWASCSCRADPAHLDCPRLFIPTEHKRTYLVSSPQDEV